MKEGNQKIEEEGKQEGSRMMGTTNEEEGSETHRKKRRKYKEGPTEN